ncbi:unnamed protein product, partial [Heterosigma akashiwo]
MEKADEKESSPPETATYCKLLCKPDKTGGNHWSPAFSKTNAPAAAPGIVQDPPTSSSGSDSSSNGPEGEEEDAQEMMERALQLLAASDARGGGGGSSGSVVP